MLFLIEIFIVVFYTKLFIWYFLQINYYGTLLLTIYYGNFYKQFIITIFTNNFYGTYFYKKIYLVLFLEINIFFTNLIKRFIIINDFLQTTHYGIIIMVLFYKQLTSCLFKQLIKVPFYKRLIILLHTNMVFYTNDALYQEIYYFTNN